MDGAVRVCVVGLHCCGDLTPSILTLFTDHSLTSLTSLILIGCCYHKAAISRWSPSSKALTEILTARQDVLFNTFALRLAAQETKHRWVWLVGVATLIILGNVFGNNKGFGESCL